MMDVNCPWSVAQTLEMLPQLQASNLLWLEEPIWPPEDFRGLKKIRDKKSIAIAAGENNISTCHFEEMLAYGSVDFAQPSVTKIGGITEMLKIMDLCQHFETPVMPHSPYFGPGLLATLHLAAILQPETMIEYSFADLGANPLGDCILMRQGRIDIPKGPGLGCDPDLDILHEFRVP